MRIEGDGVHVRLGQREMLRSQGNKKWLLNFSGPEQQKPPRLRVFHTDLADSHAHHRSFAFGGDVTLCDTQCCGSLGSCGNRNLTPVLQQLPSVQVQLEWGL